MQISLHITHNNHNTGATRNAYGAELAKLAKLNHYGDYWYTHLPAIGCELSFGTIKQAGLKKREEEQCVGSELASYVVGSLTN